MTAGSGERPLRLLHIPGPVEDSGNSSPRAVLLRHFGSAAAHTFASGGNAAGARQAGIAARQVVLPDLNGRPGPLRLQRLAEAMRGCDLVLTYGWPAINAVLAHSLFAPRLALPPLVHHEDLLPLGEADRPRFSRSAARMLALSRAQALVVPSRRLEQVALAAWRQPREKVHRIPFGIDTARYGARPRPDALPRVIKRGGELFLGTFAHGWESGDLRELVAAFAGLPAHWHLVILGAVPDSEPVLGEAVRLEVGHRVHLPGPVAAAERVLGLFDLFVLPGEPERFPLAAVEAMAAGLAVVSPAVGDVGEVVGEGNRRFLVAPKDPAALARALSEVAAAPALRAQLGAENRARARSEFDQATMIGHYAELYARVMRRPGFPWQSPNPSRRA